MKKFFLYGLMLLGGVSVQAASTHSPYMQNVINAYNVLEQLTRLYPWFHDLFVVDYRMGRDNFTTEILNPYLSGNLVPGSEAWNVFTNEWINWLPVVNFVLIDLLEAFADNHQHVVNAVNQFNLALINLRDSLV